jgi:hypothetical protein
MYLCLQGLGISWGKYHKQGVIWVWILVWLWDLHVDTRVGIGKPAAHLWAL